MFALIDGNNFYASCERLFRPDLRDKPVVVLSNNDGCAIARSNEAKALGVAMGQPYFQFKELAKREGIAVFSANFVLYGDISNRIFSICRRYCKDIEVYSIDESFLDLHGYNYVNLQEQMQELRLQVLNGLNIPTSIGIAPTKTLAKVANKIAKKFPERTAGVYQLDSKEKIEKALKWFALSDVWGIGRRYAAKLEALGIRTAWDFSQLSGLQVRQLMGIYGVRMQKELLGIPQYTLGKFQAKKSIATTRTFDKRTDDLCVLQERVATFSYRCAQKLRKQNLDLLT